jgi:hypothetical protein
MRPLRAPKFGRAPFVQLMSKNTYTLQIISILVYLLYLYDFLAFTSSRSRATVYLMTILNIDWCEKDEKVLYTCVCRVF